MGAEFRLFVWMRQYPPRSVHRMGRAVWRRAGRWLMASASLAVSLALLAGCGWENGRSQGQGQVRVEVATVTGLTPGSGEIVTAVLQKDGLQLQATLTPAAGGAGWSGSFASVPTGRWRLTVTVADAADNCQYVGTTEVEVDAGQTSQAQVRLGPAPAQLQVEVDLTAFPARERVRMAAVRIHPSVGTTTKILPDESGHLQTTLTLPARTYDMSLELYAGENLTDPLLYATPWRQIEAIAATAVRLVWKVDSGDVSVGGEVDEQPAAPQGLVATLTAAGVELTWLAAGDAAQIQEYVVYRRRDRFGRYEEVARTPPGQARLVYEPSSSDRGKTVWFAVSSWDGYNESPRSEPVWLQIPVRSEAS